MRNRVTRKKSKWEQKYNEAMYLQDKHNVQMVTKGAKIGFCRAVIRDCRLSTATKFQLTVKFF
jgi:hypothetical protein